MSELKKKSLKLFGSCICLRLRVKGTKRRAPTLLRLFEGTSLNPFSNVYHFFPTCDAAAQRGPWPPHSRGF